MACGLTVIKRFTYRGNPNEEWSNHYWFSGATPSNPTEWRALFDALVLQEKKVYYGTTSVIGGYGYDSTADNAHAVWVLDLTVPPNAVVPGTYSGGGLPWSGDQAGWVRWGLDKLNSKGKRIYLRKYFHGGSSVDTAPDQVFAALVTAYNAFGAKLRDGTFLDGRVVTDTHGTALVGTASSAYVTTRTLKRRGKRPPT